MKKFGALVLALGLCMGTLAGCGSSSDAPAQETNTETTADETATDEAATDEAATDEAAADAAIPSDLKVGFIFLHDENSTYDLNFMNAA